MRKSKPKTIFIEITCVLLLIGGYFLFGSTKIAIAPSQGVDTVSNKTTEIIFVGDIMLDRGVKYMIDRYGKSDFNFPFLKIAENLRKADIVFGNLEGPVSDKGEKAGSIYSFRMKPEAIEALSGAGFSVLSLANNHAFDYGRAALEDTYLRLEEAGIEYVGGGLNEAETDPAFKEINGAKIAFLAYTNLCPLSWKATQEEAGIKCVSEKDFENIKEEVAFAKTQADIAIVSMHAGEEYAQELIQFQTKLAHEAIDAGADLVFGHHPHVVQKSEVYQGKYIFYSLGNFIFDQNFSEETMRGQMVKVLIENKKIKEVIPINIQINDYFQPEISTTETSPRSLISVSSYSPSQGDTVLLEITTAANLKETAANFNSKPVKLFESNGKIFGIIGIDAKMAPGKYEMKVDFPDNFTIRKQVEVLKKKFPVTELAFTKELEEKGYNSSSVTETIVKNDAPKLYDAMAVSSEIPYFFKSFANPLAEIVDVGAFGNIRKSGDISLQHLGIDLDANVNTSVFAINNGVVKGALELINYGKTIVIDHGIGIFSLYLHLNEFKVKEGDKVKRGDIVGLSGNTGYSIAPHLHFSMKVSGASVNPLKFIETTKDLDIAK